MVLGFIEKAILWFNRLLQWTFSVILLGVSGSFVTEFWQAGWKTPPQVSLPCIISAFSICITFFSIITLYCLGRHLLNLAAFLDFALFVLYLTSVILNRKNYHPDGTQNDLWRQIVVIRSSAGLDPHANRNNGLVKLMVAMITILMVFYFFTTLLSFALARRADDRHHGRREVVVEERRTTRRSSGRRTTHHSHSRV